MQYTWFIWSLLLLFVWLIVYLSLSSKEERREMLIMSGVTSIFGLTEPLFVPEYWSPPSLFDLAMKTGFDIESLIFTFAAGGIVFAIYQLLLHKKHQSIPKSVRHSLKHRFHYIALWSAPVIAVVLLLGTSLNPIYAFIIATIIGGLFTLYCRPDLGKKILISTILFFAIYYVYFLTLIQMVPGYVEKVWNLKELSGFLITGVPLEELLFAFIVGFYWSSMYEHVTWRKLIE